MRYVVTFEDYDCGAVAYVVDAYYVEDAVMQAQEEARANHHNYSDGDVLSVVRI